MNWDALGAVAESVGAVGVIATLVYLALQIRHNTAAVKAATYDSVVAQFRDWNAPFREDPEMVAQLQRGLHQWESLNESEQLHAIHLWYDWFKLAENIQYQYRTGLMDVGLWKGWESYFMVYLHSPGLRWYWEQRQSFYSPEFRAWVDRMLEAGDRSEPGLLQVAVKRVTDSRKDA